MEALRKEIRKILQEDFLPKKRIMENNNPSKYEPYDWIAFEHFGWQILREVGYEGDYAPILNKVKKSLEEEGMEFIDWSEGYL
jgi:hypothetical protein